jgi:hypothetical protein
MNVSTFKSPAAWIPIAMSLAALAIVLFHVAMFGIAPQSDEGVEAHLFQLLIAGQAPIVVVYAFRSLPRVPRAAFLVVGIQVLAMVAAIAPVYLLGWA